MNPATSDVPRQSFEGDSTALAEVVSSASRDPHRFLGAHYARRDHEDGVVVRAFVPGSRELTLLTEAKRHPMERLHDDGVFAAFLPGINLPLAYRFERGKDGGSDGHADRHPAPLGADRAGPAPSGPASSQGAFDDPYRFGPTLGEIDLHLIGEGSHRRLYEKLGAHPRRIEGVAGTSFAVWAPNARRVAVVGDFNGWDGRAHQMRMMGASGVWEIFIPGVGEGLIYKYELKLPDGTLRIKTDPVAFQMELRPKNASIVHGLDSYPWGDDAWMARRRHFEHRKEPMVIYEVHLGSWRHRGEPLPDAESDSGHFLSYRELAPLLVEYCKQHSFTHLELLPIAEHAFDPSWGYQTTGYFAPTSRYGTPDDLRYFVDHCHQNGIGVILDWVPGHFPKDDFGLRWFDGSALYEHLDPREGEHRDWGTLIFNYGRNEVRAFLLSNAMYWLDQFHFDGLRVDAVASMIYKDYSREEGDWIPNEYGGRENLQAIAFLQELNRVVYEYFPGTFTAAEESTAWPGVSLPTYLGGLGFGFKWNMGWMHDTLHYFNKDPVHRQYHHNELTFNMLYAYSENFILPLSHDEVVHGKGSLMNKMPGDLWQKAANLRLLLAYFFCNTGKKLLFMGGEFGQPAEWNEAAQLEWHYAEHDPRHQGVQQLVKDLGALYLASDPLWAWDTEPRGFAWVDCNDSRQSVLSFMRVGPSGFMVCVFNFTPVPRYDYRIGVHDRGTYREVLNTDGAAYGGSNVGNGGFVDTDEVPMHGRDHSLKLTLPPLAALIFEIVPADELAEISAQQGRSGAEIPAQQGRSSSSVGSDTEPEPGPTPAVDPTGE